MTQSTTKIQGESYPLQQEEWLHAYRELTQAQLAVMSYNRNIYPPKHGIEINCTEIALLLSKPRHNLQKEFISVDFLSDEIAVTSLEVQ